MRYGILVSLSLAACPQSLPDDFVTSPGGAGAAGAAGAGDEPSPAEAAAFASLVHRYRFDGSGTRALDSVGTAHGEIVNASLTGTGQLRLEAGAAAYVDLPNGLISALTSATLEVWLVWRGGGDWQRIFDFGISSTGEGASGLGVSYLFLTPGVQPSGAGGEGPMRLAYSLTGYRFETRADALARLPTDVLVHLATVVDAQNDVLSLYVDGVRRAQAAWTGRLSDIRDVNNWLGRSQFNDPPLAADLLELRIYASALDAASIAQSHASGPDPGFLER